MINNSISVWNKPKLIKSKDPNTSTHSWQLHLQRKVQAKAIKYPSSDEQPVMYAYRVVTADWKEVLVDAIQNELKTY